jgi:D-inositol-3-phosphate glycosyltransferase
VGGLPCAIGDGGLLVDGHQTADWSAAIEGLLDDPARRELLSRKAVEHASHFSWEHTTDRLLEVYAESMVARTESAGSAGSAGPVALAASPVDDAADLSGALAVIP